MSMREDADRIHAVLDGPETTLLPLSTLAQRTGLTEPAVRAAVEAFPSEFRVTVRPLFGLHMVGNIATESEIQRAARLLRLRRGPLLTPSERAAVTDQWVVRFLEAQARLVHA